MAGDAMTTGPWLASGEQIDQWAASYDVAPRGVDESDAELRRRVYRTVTKWTVSEPELGQSLSAERAAIEWLEMALAERKRRFNVLARMRGVLELP